MNYRLMQSTPIFEDNQSKRKSLSMGQGGFLFSPEQSRLMQESSQIQSCISQNSQNQQEFPSYEQALMQNQIQGINLDILLVNNNIGNTKLRQFSDNNNNLNNEFDQFDEFDDENEEVDQQLDRLNEFVESMKKKIEIVKDEEVQQQKDLYEKCPLDYEAIKSLQIQIIKEKLERQQMQNEDLRHSIQKMVSQKSNGLDLESQLQKLEEQEMGYQINSLSRGVSSIKPSGYNFQQEQSNTQNSQQQGGNFAISSYANLQSPECMYRSYQNSVQQKKRRLNEQYLNLQQSQSIQQSQENSENCEDLLIQRKVQSMDRQCLIKQLTGQSDPNTPLQQNNKNNLINVEKSKLDEEIANQLINYQDNINEQTSNNNDDKNQNQDQKVIEGRRISNILQRGVNNILNEQQNTIQEEGEREENLLTTEAIDDSLQIGSQNKNDFEKFQDLENNSDYQENLLLQSQQNNNGNNENNNNQCNSCSYGQKMNQALQDENIELRKQLYIYCQANENLREENDKINKIKQQKINECKFVIQNTQQYIKTAEANVQHYKHQQNMQIYKMVVKYQQKMQQLKDSVNSTAAMAMSPASSHQKEASKQDIIDDNNSSNNNKENYHNKVKNLFQNMIKQNAKVISNEKKKNL